MGVQSLVAAVAASVVVAVAVVVVAVAVLDSVYRCFLIEFLDVLVDENICKLHGCIDSTCKQVGYAIRLC